ncbi:hypothetical protein M5K25_011344 [Dendrobium thyrsiflorum]|uniref:Uncharacterized protein n=1 Tax=Dendrobium thyrsiflorum TaxID=117978 RepID=A0ABD0V2I4_DENTH
MRLINVTVSRITDHEKAMRSQSLTTPATFIVRAEVFPTSRKTARLSAKAQKELVPKTRKSRWKEEVLRSMGNSTMAHGTLYFECLIWAHLDSDLTTLDVIEFVLSKRSV